MRKWHAHLIWMGHKMPQVCFPTIDKHIFITGADQGGSDVINMISYCNCRNRNTAYHSIPLAVLEDATEDYDNIKKHCKQRAEKNC